VGPGLKLGEEAVVLPQFVVGDFNGDGKPDIASMGYYPASNSFVVYLGNGDGTFTPTNQSSNASLGGYQLWVADVNSDGKLDLVIANDLGVLIGNGDGTFQPVILSNVATGVPPVLAIADFNGDGEPDVATTDGSGNISILAGNGDGTFRPSTARFAAGVPAAIAFAGGMALGDFNGDGRVDVAISVNPTAGAGVSILLGQAAAPPTVQTVSVTPYAGSGASQLFTLELSDSAGAADIASMSVMIASGSPYYCLGTYTRATNSLALAPSGVTSSTTMSNSACTVQLAQSGPTTADGTTQLFNLAVSFNGTMQGSQYVSALVTSASGVTSGWQTLGTWTVTASTAGPASAVSVVPASGTGMTQTFRFTYLDPSGPGDLAYVMASIGSSVASGCVVQVTPNNNQASLTQGVGFSGVGPGPLGSQDVLQNSQCSLNLAQSSAVWSGNTFAITLSFTFPSSYSGHQYIYAEAVGVNVTSPAWQTLGTWTVGGPSTNGYFVSTFAGGALPATTMPAAASVVPNVSPVATDNAGNVYFGAPGAVYRMDTAGNLARLAGTGVIGYSVDGGPAVLSEIGVPQGLAIDSLGNLYFSDQASVRRISPEGIITTVALGLSQPEGIAVDAAGNLYIAEVGASRVLKVDPALVITTVANELAYGVALDAAGNLYLAEKGLIRKVSPSGAITTIAGNGSFGDPTNNQPATSVSLTYVSAIAADAAGDVYFAYYSNLYGQVAVVKVAVDGTLTFVAGNETAGGVELVEVAGWAYGLAVDPSGNLYLGDYLRLRKISNGVTSTVAGGGSGDGPAAPLSTFLAISGIARDNFGNTYISDSYTSRVHKVDPSGNISTVAGNGVSSYSGDGGPAISAELNAPNSLAVDSSGNLYIEDQLNCAIREVTGGIITTVAGTGNGSFCPPEPGLAVGSGGAVYVVTDARGTILQISSGGVSVVAGTGVPGYSGDGQSATTAQIDAWDLAIDGQGNLYFPDAIYNRIRRISNGIITTIAGNGTAGSSGDGWPATAAELTYPTNVAVDPTGDVYFVDSAKGSVRKIAIDGTISTVVAGGTSQSISGGAFAADASGNFYVNANVVNPVTYLLTPQGGPPVLTINSTHSGNFALGSTGQYTLTVGNASLAGPANGTVTVNEIPPSGLTISSMSGTGWNCSGNSCSRSDALSPGGLYPTITANVSVQPDALSQATNQATVAGAGAAMSATQDLTVLTAPSTTLQTNPPGLQVSIDGFAPQTTPLTIPLAPGPHLIGVPSPQPLAIGSQYVLNSWSDGGAETHAVDVTATPATYIATFQTQFQLTTSVFPPNAGSVNVASGTFFDAGSTVGLTATPNSSYALVSWGGADLGASSPTTITMNSPQSITADFGPPGFTCSVITGNTIARVTDVQFMINEALGIAAPNHDLNSDAVVNVADVQKVIEAATGAGCLY
jgi:uncharacterized repeat protein (TIGR01451 family)